MMGARALIVLGLVGGCAPSNRPPAAFVRDAAGHLSCPHELTGWSTDEPLPEVRGSGYRGRIVPPAAAVAFFCQCSRDTGGPPDGYWSPAAADIAQLEEDLPFYVRANPPSIDPRPWRDLALYVRLYMGIVRDGHRHVAVSLVRSPYAIGVWPRETGVGSVCDGGPMFFGVEYDLDGHRFVSIAYNGPA